MVPVAPDRTLTVSWVFTPEQEPFTQPRRAPHQLALQRRASWTRTRRSVPASSRGSGARTYERGVLNRNERAIAHYHDLLREMVPGIDEG